MTGDYPTSRTTWRNILIAGPFGLAIAALSIIFLPEWTVTVIVLVSLSVGLWVQWRRGRRGA